MNPTLKDIARLSGFSTATVSRVLNDDPHISDSTRKKIQSIIKQSGYRMNTVARSLKLNKTQTVGFLAPELSNEFFMSIAQGAEDEFRKNGYSMLIANSNESIDGEKERLNLFIEKCIDGIIIIPATSEGYHFHLLGKSGIPSVLADRLVDNFDSDSVLSNNIDGTYQAVTHLIQNDVKIFGFIGGTTSLTSARERYAGFIKALRDHDIPVYENLLKFGNFHIDSGYKLMEELLNTEPVPEQVFISNYFMQVGATLRLREQLPRPPISIAGFDDMGITPLLGFSSLSIKQPVEEIGRQAASLLISRIQKIRKGPPKHIRLNTEIKFY